MPEKNRSNHVGGSGEGSTSPWNGASTEEKILEAHTIIQRIFAATGATGLTPSFTGAEGPQYRFSFYYPSAASWPSASAGSWSGQPLIGQPILGRSVLGQPFTGQPYVGQPLGFAPFGFMGFR